MPHFINSIVALADMTMSKTAHSPMSHTQPILEPATEVDWNYPYATMIGRLLWVSRTVRPDITFVVHLLARFTSSFGNAHITALKRVFRYLASTPHLGITYDGNTPFDEIVYCDADFATQHGCKSTSGCIVMLGGGPVMWTSKKQSAVSLSTMEAEFYALANAVQELIWLRNLLKGLSISVDLPSTILCDNQAVIDYMDNPNNRSRAKHIDIRFEFVRDYFKNKRAFDLAYVPTKDNLADLLTKPLPYPQHWYLANSIHGIHAPDVQWALGWHFPHSYFEEDVDDHLATICGLRGSVEEID
ncbi:hypothetical protein FRC09_000738 [Ceratobasidium sp. 395]|nr:hypothetical protein FRC09_000738 [Ceratobasidium sp. 395]